MAFRYERPWQPPVLPMVPSPGLDFPDIRETSHTKEEIKKERIHTKGAVHEHDSQGTDRPEVYHGAFSTCICKGCMEDAKIEVEKRFSDENLTTRYIKKLEELVNNLQMDLDDLQQDEPGDRYRQAYPDSPRRLDRFDPPEIVPKDNAALQRAEGPKAEIRRRRKYATKFGEPVEEDDYVVVGDSTVRNLSNKNVLTVFRHFDADSNFLRTNIEIVSPDFVEVLRQVSEYDIEIPVVDDVLTLEEPLKLLFHHRKHLEKYVENDDGDALPIARAHTKLIVDYMRRECEGVSSKLDDLESVKSSGLITFPNIWLLYSPGTMVYTIENGEHEAFIVDQARSHGQCPPDLSGKRLHNKLELLCWSINYDGEIFGREWSIHWISPFDGTREISTLDLVPEKFLPDAVAVKESLRARGKEFFALQGQNYREYTGEVWSQHMNEEPIRVMVDHLTYQRRMNWPIAINGKKGPSDALSKNWKDNKFASRGRTFDCGFSYEEKRDRIATRLPPPRIGTYEDPGSYYGIAPPRYDEPYLRVKGQKPAFQGNSRFQKYDVLKSDCKPDDLTLSLCPQHVHGYCLRDKIWKPLNVSQLKPVAFRKNAWDRLVLDPQYKDIIQAMVSSYVEKGAKLDDLVAGKGAGLVALLHGPPGTGKTLTAECVADSFEKPLYQVTCGDIGTNPETLEAKLEEIFDYAVTWGAILLLDEADVFLQDRDYENLQRNALVSIFLRTLEYFTGILFLTTNRVGTFDQAFQSRIHVTLGLPQLDRARRAEVWSIFIHELARQRHITPPQQDTLDALVATTWSREPLNGRQIRNGVRTAMLIAEKRDEQLAPRHFETVLRIGNEFAMYMEALRKGEDEAVAEGKGDRLADLAGFQEVERP